MRAAFSPGSIVLRFAAWLLGLTLPVAALSQAPAPQAPALAPQALAAAQPSVQAAARAPAGAPDNAEDAIRFMVEREVGASHRVEVRIGPLDPRLQLSACARAEPFLPPGTRLWGRAWIGLRCVEGAAWSVRLPVNVIVYGKAMVAIAPLAAGTSVTATDFRVEEVDLTREAVPLVVDPAQLAGKVLVRPVPAGQALRADALRVPPTVNAGDQMKIIITGQGFTILSEGVALAPAADGQPLRVRTESGKVVTGTLRDRSIEVRL